MNKGEINDTSDPVLIRNLTGTAVTEVDSRTTGSFGDVEGLVNMTAGGRSCSFSSLALLTLALAFCLAWTRRSGVRTFAATWRSPFSGSPCHAQKPPVCWQGKHQSSLLRGRLVKDVICDLAGGTDVTNKLSSAFGVHCWRCAHSGCEDFDHQGSQAEVREKHVGQKVSVLSSQNDPLGVSSDDGFLNGTNAERKTLESKGGMEFVEVVAFSSHAHVLRVVPYVLCSIKKPRKSEQILYPELNVLVEKTKTPPCSADVTLLDTDYEISVVTGICGKNRRSQKFSTHA
ncbi:unnamed protein product [Notodromas monacha]|uniref:Uncharacterized protein n=1 Tax=Notodromas monacha TaxID=399045 RepID=A0A7R9GE30_9CRUS|nr:unnamed protein product [Notodromas monacha]CAG0919179.1 unnamed protein product [Notodromas monacha]